MLGAPGLDSETWESTNVSNEFMRCETWVSEEKAVNRTQARS